MLSLCLVLAVALILRHRNSGLKLLWLRMHPRKYAPDALTHDCALIQVHAFRYAEMRLREYQRMLKCIFMHGNMRWSSQIHEYTQQATVHVRVLAYMNSKSIIV